MINNVGASYDHAMFFHELDDDTVSHLTKLNVDSTNIVTKMCLPGMLEKKKGAIVLIHDLSTDYEYDQSPRFQLLSILSVCAL